MKSLDMNIQHTVNKVKQETPANLFQFIVWLRAKFNLLLIQFVALGQIPTHIAFIMDGNRRYARKKHLSSSLDGHRAGSKQLDFVLNWSFYLGVKEVTVYAFSHENFKRSKEEVDGLFRIGESAFKEFIKDQSFIHTNRIRIRICGDLSLLPSSLREAAEQLMQETAKYTKRTLNICCAYTSSREIYELVSGKQPLYIENPVDLLIRTSGEHRLSDFLLWQVSSSPKSQTMFVKKYWPEFSLFYFLYTVLIFQINRLISF